MENIKVRDAMVKRVITIKSDSTAYQAAKLMRDEDIGSVVIVKGETPVGIVTREDMTNKIAAEDLRASEVPVTEIMSSSLVTCDIDDDIITAAKKMAKYGYKQLPVTYMNKLVGFISVREILAIAPALIEIFRERLSESIGGESERTVDGECELCGNYSEGLRNVNGRWVCETCSEEAEEI